MTLTTKEDRNKFVLPSQLEGEADDVYWNKYKVYLNPVSDRSKYGHITGQLYILSYLVFHSFLLSFPSPLAFYKKHCKGLTAR